METLYFTLGILTVLVIIGVVGVVKVWNKVSALSLIERDLTDHINEIADDVNDELGKMHDELHNRMDQLERDFQGEASEIVSMMDSRFDKFENKVNIRLEKVDATIGNLLVKFNK